MKKLMDKQSSDTSLQDDRMARLSDQSCIDEVARLLSRYALAHHTAGSDEKQQMLNDHASHHFEL